MGVSNLNLNWIPVIGCPGDSHVNFAHFNGYLRTVSNSFPKSVTDFFLKLSSQDIKFPDLLKIGIISNWTKWSTILGVIVHVTSKRPRASRSSDF